MNQKVKRIAFLDSLRGLAILMVIGYHAFVRWPTHVPYGADWSGFPLFEYGWMGVELFFLISGFVIYMTLENTSDIVQFIYKRWLRLFPAMLICSSLIYLTSFSLPERPVGQPTYLSLIPGLTFIEPYWWEKLLGVGFPKLEGAFWSIFVEFKFYAIAGLVYYFVGKRVLPVVLVGLFFYSLGIRYLFDDYTTGVVHYANILNNALSLEYFGWFAAGACYYLFLFKDSKNAFWYAVGIGIISAFTVKGTQSTDVMVAALFVVLLFSASIRIERIQRWLNNRFLLYFGFVSYPLYLIHENAMIAMVTKLGANVGFVEPKLFPFLVVLFLSLIAYIIAKYCERPLKQALQYSLDNTLFKVLAKVKYSTK